MQAIPIPKFYAMMVLFDSELRSEIYLLLDLAKIKNFTLFVDLHGSSEHGRKEGSVSWPGANEILLLIVSSQQMEELKKILQDYKNERANKPGFLTFSWELTEIL